MKKLLIALVILLIVAIAGSLTYVKVFLPNVGAAPDLTVERTANRIERGRYLAHSVTLCIDCHSERNWNKFAGPMVPGSWGSGGEAFTEKFGFPGSYYAPNITPYGIGDWTDGELFRAITAGVSKDGRALFPIMPYHHYGQMAEEDIFSIIAYIRTLEPIEKNIPVSTSNFPMNFIINTIPEPPSFNSIPPKADEVAYGKYLTNAAGCIDCHTQQNKGQLVEGMHFAGGFEFPIPQGTVTSTNITPDKETGIGSWNEQMFVARFKQYADPDYTNPSVGPKEFNTVMPWMMYADMKEDDLAAIFAYLQTVEPVNNTVTERFKQ